MLAVLIYMYRNLFPKIFKYLYRNNISKRIELYRKDILLKNLGLYIYSRPIYCIYIYILIKFNIFNIFI